MTRNEWIAETAAKLVCVPLKPGFSNHTSDEALMVSMELADALEAANVAPWQQTPAPALSETGQAVIEAAVNYVDGAPTGDCDFEVAAAVNLAPSLSAIVRAAVAYRKAHSKSSAQVAIAPFDGRLQVTIDARAALFAAIDAAEGTA